MKNLVNNLRVLGVETITNAKSGHPGVVLSAAPIFYSIFKNLKVDLQNPKYFNRDFFVASAGHASSLLYSTMHLFNMGISVNDLKNFRKVNSITPGHPELETPFVDCATGPLGQGVANSVGLAISQKHLAKIFNKKDIKIFNGYTYCFLGDGCLMEGVALEAFSIAGKLKLNNLIFVYDRNNKTIEGGLDIAYEEDTVAKFKAMGFNVIEVMEGNNEVLIEKAIINAKVSDKPNLIIVNTIIGFGSHVEDSEISHGKPFTTEEVKKLKEKFNIKNEPFQIDKNIYDFINKINLRKEKEINKEKKILERYKKKYPEDYKKLEEYLNFGYSAEAIKKLDKLNIENNLSTRENNHIILNSIFNTVKNVLGGSADVNTSTMVYLKDEKYLNDDFENRNIHFGVREHAMGAISNGITLSGALLSFCSCYLSFSDYLKPALRMAALMDLPVFYQFSHDNFLIGEDGPTHQPVEQLVTLRATPNVYTFRPYNNAEIIAAYRFYLETKKPTCLVLSKEKVENKKYGISNALKGAYTVYKEEGELKGVILSSGIEVSIAINIAKKLKGVRVVSIPCFELFDKQSEKYKQSILTDKPKIALEFSSSYSYHKYCKDGLYLTMENFGKSGNKNDLRKDFNLDDESIIKKIKKFLKENE
ncbi:MAG: transketolase [Clostridiales bacterium]|nr:transketolase [Clostridiales bacterium]